MKTYKLNFKNHLRHIWPILLYAIAMPFIGHYIFITKLGQYSNHTAFNVWSVFIVLFVFPSLILHLNHYLKCRNCIFEYNKLSGKIAYIGSSARLDFYFRDIRKIMVYKSWPIAQGRTPIFAWDIYNYSKIELKEGKILKVSSLLVYELDKIIKVQDIKIKKTFYPWIS